MNDKKSPPTDADLVRDLAAIMRDSGLTEIELERGGLKVKLSRGAVMQVAAPQALQSYAPPPPAALPAPTPLAETAPPAAIDLRTHPGAVNSPMVGTAFLSPEPGAAPFVKPGDSVTEGQTLMVVEAMKTFNPIPAPRAGKITAILVTDAQPVEFGEPLLIIE